MTMALAPEITQNALINLHNAAREGDNAREALSTTLYRYIGEGALITPDGEHMTAELADALAAAEGSRVFNEYLEDRLRGQRNDKKSFGGYPQGGLTALVCDLAVDRATHELGSEAFLVEPTELSVDLPAYGERRLHFIRFSEGFFTAESGGIVGFYVDRPSYVRNSLGIKPSDGTFFTVNQEVVSRVEGDAGEYWQYPNHGFPDNKMRVSLPTPIIDK